MIVFDLDCQNCGSTHTDVELETAYDRRCRECNHIYDIRPPEMIEDDRLHTFIR